jgi:hypothetical protein
MDIYDFSKYKTAIVLLRSDYQNDIILKMSWE